VKVTYDPGVDVLYIFIRTGDTPAVDSMDIETGITADLDAKGRVLGIEILDARKKTGNDANFGVTFELLGSEPLSASQ
jgi:uncharacterized protein YuzE